jgi:hypothetical protein
MPTGTVMVIAKEPLPGRVKTRLCPPCCPEQAAALAAAALRDTLDAVAGAPARRRVLVFEGDGERWRPPGFELLVQRGGGLSERLAWAFEDVGEPALLVGMDTPQLTAGLLAAGLRTLEDPAVDAVLGPALDGGYWGIGLKAAFDGVFQGVPMSRSDTCMAQRRRLRDLGLRWREQPHLRDVDTMADARLVASQAPGSRFAAALGELAGL